MILTLVVNGQEGVACIVYGFMCLFIMPKRPTSTTLLCEGEKQHVTRVLVEDNISAETVDHRKFLLELRRSLAQPHVLLVSLAGFLSGIALLLSLRNVLLLTRADVTSIGLSVCVTSAVSRRDLADQTAVSCLVSS